MAKFNLGGSGIKAAHRPYVNLKIAFTISFEVMFAYFYETSPSSHDRPRIILTDNVTHQNQ